MYCESFAPIVNKQCRLLILGSMPGVKSLQAQEYYAHPQNRFWKLLATVLQPDLNFASYEEKKAFLLAEQIALWDVLAICEREGSLDSDIAEEQPNDILGLLQRNPQIKQIICNGGKAGSAFKKYFAKQIPPTIQVFYLHSTSPANARMRLADLAAEWGPVVQFKDK